jgi:hypothetical protein
MSMVNLLNVIHTCGGGAPNDYSTSTATLVVDIGNGCFHQHKGSNAQT